MEIVVQGTGRQVDPTLQQDLEHQPMHHLLNFPVIPLYTEGPVVAVTRMEVVLMESTLRCFICGQQLAPEKVPLEGHWMKFQDQHPLGVEEEKFLQMGLYHLANVFHHPQDHQLEGQCQIVGDPKEICCLQFQK